MGNRQIVAVISDNRRHHLFDLVEEVDLTELQGPPGPSGGNAYSPTTTAFTVPMPGETVEVILHDGSWLVVGMMLYAEGAGGAPDATRYNLRRPWIILSRHPIGPLRKSFPSTSGGR